jgi:hypothetical protein
LPKGPIDSAFMDLVEEVTEEVLGVSNETDLVEDVADIVIGCR